MRRAQIFVFVICGGLGCILAPFGETSTHTAHAQQTPPATPGHHPSGRDAAGAPEAAGLTDSSAPGQAASASTAPVATATRPAAQATAVTAPTARSDPAVQALAAQLREGAAQTTRLEQRLAALQTGVERVEGRLDADVQRIQDALVALACHTQEALDQTAGRQQAGFDKVAGRVASFDRALTIALNSLASSGGGASSSIEAPAELHELLVEVRALRSAVSGLSHAPRGAGAGSSAGAPAAAASREPYAGMLLHRISALESRVNQQSARE